MKWNHRRNNLASRKSRSSTAIRQASIETLENRQMLSATVEIRTTSGGTTVAATSVGQVIDLNVYVVVAGKTSGVNDGFQSVTGSIIGTQTSSGGVIGNMVSHVTPDYTAESAQDGTPTDLNGDGGLDIGSNNNEFITGFFYPRAGGIEQDGTVSGDSQTFLVGTLTYTVKSLGTGSSTDINFRVRDIDGGAYEAVWEEDGTYVTDESATLEVGTPLVVTGPKATAKASIAGYVFNDVNGDGKWESNEKGVAGVTVFLDTNKNGVLDSGEPTQVTNSSGGYIFTGLAAGTYKVEEVVPSGEKLTTVGSYTITLSATTASSSKNFGNEATQAGNASIAGTVTKVVGGVTSDFSGVVVYLDKNDNGTLDAGEPETTTSSTGTYSFVGLAAGTYYLREVVPSGYTQTSPTSSPTTITVAAGKAVTGENFTDTAVAAGKGSISGYVFDDANGDGKWESNEKAVAGVEIFIDSNKNGVLDSGEVHLLTNSSGEYTFSGLAAGTYRVREVVPAGKKLTTVAYYDVTIPAGYNSTGKNFGND